MVLERVVQDRIVREYAASSKILKVNPSHAAVGCLEDVAVFPRHNGKVSIVWRVRDGNHGGVAVAQGVGRPIVIGCFLAQHQAGVAHENDVAGAGWKQAHAIELGPRRGNVSADVSAAAAIKAR